MRLLWLCNLMPGKVKEKLYGSEQNGGLWVDHVLSGLRQLGMTILVLCPGDGSKTDCIILKTLTAGKGERK